MKNQEIIHRDEPLTVVYATYQNDNIAIQLFCEDGPYATATSWLPGLSKNEVAIKDYSENIGMYSLLLENDIIEPSHRNIRSGYVIFPICYLTQNANKHREGN